MYIRLTKAVKNKGCDQIQFEESLSDLRQIKLENEFQWVINYLKACSHYIQKSTLTMLWLDAFNLNAWMVKADLGPFHTDIHGYHIIKYLTKKIISIRVRFWHFDILGPLYPHKSLIPYFMYPLPLYCICLFA